MSNRERDLQNSKLLYNCEMIHLSVPFIKQHSRTFTSTFIHLVDALIQSNLNILS